MLILETPLIKKVKILKRRKWSHNINLARPTYGEFHHLFPHLLQDPERFRGYFRMRIETFNYILEKIQNRIQKQNTNYRLAITPTEKLAITLR